MCKSHISRRCKSKIIKSNSSKFKLGFPLSNSRTVGQIEIYYFLFFHTFMHWMMYRCTKSFVVFLILKTFIVFYKYCIDIDKNV